MKTFILPILFAMVACQSLSAQTTGKLAFEVGKPCPRFTIQGVSEIPIHGKPLILDFWEIGCSACIKGFWKVNGLQEKFSEVNFLVVGKSKFRTGSNEDVAKETYLKYQQRWNLKLKAGYGDADFFRQLHITDFPLYVWIDEKNIVKGITYGSDLDEKNILAFLKGETIGDRLEQSQADQVLFDYHRPLLLYGNGGSDSSFLYRSILSMFKLGTGQYFQNFVSSVTRPNGKSMWAGVERNRVQMNGVTLRELIEVAWGDTVSHNPGIYYPGFEPERRFMALSSYGTYWRKPISEMASDSSVLDGDWKTGHEFYSYSLIVPMAKASAAYLKKIMQSDIHNYFGYEVSIEERDMPCWYLSATPAAKKSLQTQGGKYYRLNEAGEMNLRNAPVYQLIRCVYEYNANQPPIIDLTGITDHIDISFKAVMMDFSDVKDHLEKSGLLLEKRTRKMKVIVVRDRRE